MQLKFFENTEKPLDFTTVIVRVSKTDLAGLRVQSTDQGLEAYDTITGELVWTSYKSKGKYYRSDKPGTDWTKR